MKPSDLNEKTQSFIAGFITDWPLIFKPFLNVSYSLKFRRRWFLQLCHSSSPRPRQEELLPLAPYFRESLCHSRSDTQPWHNTNSCSHILHHSGPRNTLLYISFICHQNKITRELPGSPVVRTPHFHCRGPGFNSWPGN